GVEGTQGWETTILPAPELGGLSNVLLRFALRADGNAVNEGGFGFDNIEIEEAEVPPVVINEFNYTDSRGEAYDFVELKNTGTTPVDMADFRLNFVKKTGGVVSQYDTILAPPMAGVVAPGDYYLIGDTASAFLFGVDVLALNPSQGVLGDTGAIELVYTPLGIRRDVVAYGDDISGFTEGNAIDFADPGNLFYRGTGFSRLPDGDDIQNNLADFRFRCYTPGYTNEPTDSVCYTPKLVINEFNYADPSGEAFDFIELRNNDTEDIDLADFELILYDEAAGLTMPALLLGGILNPDDYYVIGAPNGVQNQDFTLLSAPDYVEGPNGSIELDYVPNGAIADLVGYGSSFPGFDENGPITTVDEARFIDYVKSFARDAGGVDTDDNDLDFTFECHTPGEENGSSDVCVSPMVINEVDKLGANGDSVFVELYNRTPILADLDGFILEFDDATNLDSIILDGTIGNQAYRVFGIPSAGFNSDHVTIMLQDTQSTTIVDRLTIAQTPVGLPNTEGEFSTLDESMSLSISRIPNGQDLNDNNNDFDL
ncbi:MAG: lamin tail domain-containing protein, partial [Flavobacteriales bacterium]